MHLFQRFLQFCTSGFLCWWCKLGACCLCSFFCWYIVPVCERCRFVHASANTAQSTYAAFPSPQGLKVRPSALWARLNACWSHSHLDRGTRPTWSVALIRFWPRVQYGMSFVPAVNEVHHLCMWWTAPLFMKGNSVGRVSWCGCCSCVFVHGSSSTEVRHGPEDVVISTSVMWWKPHLLIIASWSRWVHFNPYLPYVDCPNPRSIQLAIHFAQPGLSVDGIELD